MHTSLPALFITLAFLSPSLALAQTPPPPATPGSHPNATPPTAAPKNALAPAPLPNGQMTVSPTTTPSKEPGTANGPSTAASSTDSVFPYVIAGFAVVVLVAVGWFLLRRKGGAQGGPLP